MPNAEFWRELPGLVADGFAYSKNKVDEVMSRGQTSYQRVDVQSSYQRGDGL